MKSSSESKKFGVRFIQDLHLVALNDEEVCDFVLKPFKGEESDRLRSFIERAFFDPVSDEALQRLW